MTIGLAWSLVTLGTVDGRQYSPRSERRLLGVLFGDNGYGYQPLAQPLIVIML